jgi:uncharacterized protein (DUF342 family)
MSARLTVTAPRGGAPVTEEQVRAALAQRGVVSGLKDDVLVQAVAGAAESALIAEGRPPTSGKPAQFESLIDALKKNKHEIDENAIIDYRDMGNLIVVGPGDPLMRRTPAEPGLPGENVLGKPVAPSPVSDTPFAPKLPGATLSADDPCLLVAAVAGVPREVKCGVAVNPLDEIEAVDLRTGNIDFKGSLRVSGDIAMNMKVRVSGDLIVNGAIESAEVHADGNITVNGGIIGMAESRSHGGQEQSRIARITCGGTVKARYISSARVDAAQSVMAEREVRQCDILAGESVVVGSSRGEGGVITGGHIHAMKLVQAGMIGSISAAPTEIRVGLNPHAQAKRDELAAEEQSLTDQKEKLEKLLWFLAKHPEKNTDGLGERARETLRMLADSQAVLDARKADLTTELAPLPSACIIARKHFYSGVTLHVVNKAMEVFEDQIGGKAILQNEQVVITNIGPGKP